MDEGIADLYASDPNNPSRKTQHQPKYTHKPQRRQTASTKHSRCNFGRVPITSGIHHCNATASQLQSPTTRRNALRRQSSYCVDVASSSVPSADRPHGPPGSADLRGTAAVCNVPFVGGRSWSGTRRQGALPIIFATLSAAKKIHNEPAQP
ncbi:hypothetical protein GQ607_003344 [Colletotrichum asianum]|uniref:Uncharacterized protein n=1 Tax=Colletotrichum asianum TaxID=702518 RepID=A0A8H3ZY55_9PEZI|nr:hypothetical protein GQ607_003344 [Colletotrichum asianum]